MQGFVTVDMMNDRSMQITYYTYANQGIKADFTYHYSIRKSSSQRRARVLSMPIVLLYG